MNPGLRKMLAMALVAPGCLAVGLFDREGRGDEPGPLGRLFRLGDRNPPVSGSGSSASFGSQSAPTPALLPASAAPTPPMPAPSTPPIYPGPTSSTMASETSTSNRIVPQPRVSRAATESDPILSRVVIGRSDNGSRFGMFLQVYADGTVMDGEGTHNVGRDALRPLVEAIESSQALQLRGHCGGPPTDFVEQVHIVVYERSFGKLRANAFSFSGNPQGCDPGVRGLQTALDALQARLSGSPVSASTTPATPAFSNAPPSGRVIPLTPLQ